LVPFSYYPRIRSLTLGWNTKPGGGGTNYPKLEKATGWGEWMVWSIHGYFQSQARQLTSSAFVRAIFWNSGVLFDDLPETIRLVCRRLLLRRGGIFMDLCRQAQRSAG
jgi:hypothetical protein